MARAGQQAGEADGGLEDRISVGVLARAFPRELVDEVIDAAGKREQRRRVLPAWLTLYFTLALALFACACLANPKSNTFAPAFVNIMLPGFRSR